MWLKILLSGLVPLIVAGAAGWIVGDPKAVEAEIDRAAHRGDALRKVGDGLSSAVDRASNALIVYGATRDKSVLEQHETAAAEIPAAAAAVGKLAIEDGRPYQDADLKSDSTKLLAAFKQYKEQCNAGKPSADKLSASVEEWSDASRNLSGTVDEMKGQTVLGMFMALVRAISTGGVFVAVFGGLTWFLMIIFMGGSCHKRYHVVRRNIVALSEGKPLESLTKCGCGDEIEKLDKAVHEAAAKMGKTA